MTGVKLIDTDKKVLIDNEYDDIINAKNNNIIVVQDSKYGLTDELGKEKIVPSYEYLEDIFGTYYIAERDGKYGIIDVNDKKKINFKYTYITYIAEADILQADISETESVILDSNLSEKIKGIVSEINTEKGYIKVYTDDEYKYYNFKFEEKKVADILTSNNLFLSKKDDKYGYVDISGKVVVDYIYDDAKEQNREGFAAVKKGKVWGSIDRVRKNSFRA